MWKHTKTFSSIVAALATCVMAYVMWADFRKQQVSQREMVLPQDVMHNNDTAVTAADQETQQSPTTSSSHVEAKEVDHKDEKIPVFKIDFFSTGNGFLEAGRPEVPVQNPDYDEPVKVIPLNEVFLLDRGKGKLLPIIVKGKYNEKVEFTLGGIAQGEFFKGKPKKLFQVASECSATFLGKTEDGANARFFFDCD